MTKMSWACHVRRPLRALNSGFHDARAPGSTVAPSAASEPSDDLEKTLECLWCLRTFLEPNKNELQESALVWQPALSW